MTAFIITKDNIADEDEPVIPGWELAEKLYVASYPSKADRERIQPLAERPQWEQQVWLRVASAAIKELTEED